MNRMLKLYDIIPCDVYYLSILLIKIKPTIYGTQTENKNKCQYL